MTDKNIKTIFASVTAEKKVSGKLVVLLVAMFAAFILQLSVYLIFCRTPLTEKLLTRTAVLTAALLNRQKLW